MPQCHLSGSLWVAVRQPGRRRLTCCTAKRPGRPWRTRAETQNGTTDRPGSGVREDHEVAETDTNTAPVTPGYDYGGQEGKRTAPAHLVGAAGPS